MRQSKKFIPTLKEVPAEAQIVSYELMLRAGLIRQLAAGIFSWLPLGYRVLKKIMQILREEMDSIDSQEFYLPALNPIEIWEQTGRVEAMGDVMFKIKNREGLVLAPTHEEIITYHAKQHISSYKDLPQMWYQIQSKFRNEPRPKSGVLRGRQFIMKDAYSLDSSEDGLDKSYDSQYEAYHKIFNRCGIKFFVVGASSGAMGGNKSQEFMVESDAGEDLCVIADGSGYASNLEIANSGLTPVSRLGNSTGIEEFATPNAKTINDLIEQYNLPEERCAKSVVYMIDSEPVLILMRGNDELNESKLESVFMTNDFRPAEEKELHEFTGAGHGSIGPINLKSKMKIVADLLLQDANGLVSGANRDGFHFKNIDLKRDCAVENYYDLRTVQEGEPCPINGSPLRIVKAIELGHIFKLGTKYSEAMSANFLDVNGREKPIIMGSYGIGVERILACFIEQNHDERGIVWNEPILPFQVHLLGLMIEKSEVVKQECEKIYEALQSKGFEVLYDDRRERPGVKFNDADLIGIPLQVIVGKKGLEDNKIEMKIRKTSAKEHVEKDDIIQAIIKFFSK